MKSITDIFVRRPVIAIVVNLIVLIAGVQAIRSLTVRQYPKSENAAITITTAYVGADAKLVRGFVTTPLERAIAEANGIDYLQSQSSQGLSVITARLELDYDSTKALAEISSKVDRVRGDLPPEAEIPIINIESADSQFAAAYLSFDSEFLEQNEITDYLVRIVQPRLSAVQGVQRADILGARTFALRAWLDPDKMAAFNVNPSQVRAALGANNYLAAVGRSKGAMVQTNLSTNTDLTSVEEFKDLVVRENGGAVVRLKDVATVTLGAEDYESEVRFSGKTAVFMGVWALPDANSTDVIRQVRKELDQMKSQFPKQLNANVGYDSTEYIQNAIDEVVKTLGETLLIVILVLYLTLGSMRSALVPVVAIPVSLIGAVFLMQLFGFTLNLLTLLAIVLAVGLVVDDAIVVVENVERHLREGKTRLKAALISARELTGPVIAMTLTLAAVYAPIGFQGGLTGSLFREFALTLAGAVVISGFVALTLSPMMSSKLLSEGGKEMGFAGRVNRTFDRIRTWYGRGLDRAMNQRGVVYTFWVVFSLLAVLMFSQSPKELAPTEDSGVIFGITESPANATLDQMSRFSSMANKAFFQSPETSHTFQLTFADGGFGGMILKPWDQRDRSAFEVLPEVRERLHMIPGVRMFPIIPPALPGGGDFPVEFLLTSTEETSEILPFMEELQKRATESGMFAFPPLIDVKVDRPEVEIDIDREKVAQLGLNLQQVAEDISSAMGGNFVNRFSIAGRSYKVIPQVARKNRLNPDQVRDIYVTGPQGELVALSTFADLKTSTEPRSLNRFQQLNAVKLSGVSIRPLDDALTFLETEADKIVPQGYNYNYTGESRQLREEGNTFLPLFALAVVLIFLVLAAQFNSFRDPLVILLGSVPLAMFGASIFTFLKMPNPEMPFFTNGWTTTLNVYSQVGLVTLVGLVAKNAILIVEFANELQRKGKTKLEAIKEASGTRLRPIFMTTAATVLGHFPLVLVTGPGAEARNSIGLVLVSGMAIGTLFTLFAVPGLYMLIAQDHKSDASEAERSAPSGEDGDMGMNPALEPAT